MSSSMKKITILSIALLGAFAWTGCVKDAFVEKDPSGPVLSARKDSVWTLTVKAVRADSPLTRGLAIGDAEEEATTTTLKSVWTGEDAVKVYLGTELIGTLEVIPDGDPHTATLVGTVTISDVTPGSTRLTFLTPRETIEYTGQKGHLLPAYGRSYPIESYFHYTIATGVLVTDVYASNITTEKATFVPMQSIYRMSFRFQDGGVGDKTAITAKSVNISGAAGRLVRSQTVDGTSVTEGDIPVLLQTPTSNPFFVALRNGDETNAEVFTFTVVDEDGATYKGTKTIPASDKPNGKFVSMKNATLTSRLDIPVLPDTKDTVL